MRIATYNVNGINGRLPRLLEWLAETEPDVVCLQELKTDDTKFPITALRDAGYEAIWHGQRSYHGVAILAKGVGPVEVRRGLPDEPADVHTRYLEARVGGLTIASIYLPNGNPVASPNYAYKLRWFERLIRYSRGLIGRPAVLAGDLNVVPTDFDVYNPEYFRGDAVMQPAVRDAYQRLLDLGWVDTARYLYPKQRIYTYWFSQRHLHQDKGWRLDFLLINEPLVSRLTEFGVDKEYRGREKPSDHTPVWIEITPDLVFLKSLRHRS